MIAGGLGSIDAGLTQKIQFPAGTLLIQLGGPGMRIGMGGGAASSMATGANAAELDFDSVQRGNPEIERRAQEVINHCWQRALPIRSWRSTTSARAACQRLPGVDQRRRPRCAIRPARRAAGRNRPGAQGNLVQREPGALRAGDCAGISGAVPAFCERERCPFSVVGVATEERQLVVARRTAGDGDTPVDMPMNVLLGKPPKMHRDVKTVARSSAARPHWRRPAEGRHRGPVAPHRGLQALSRHHRRPHRRRPEPPRPDGRPVAGAGGRLSSPSTVARSAAARRIALRVRSPSARGCRGARPRWFIVPVVMLTI